MLFKDIAIIDENLDYQEHQWVGVLDGVIDYIGGEEPPSTVRCTKAKAACSCPDSTMRMRMRR